MSMTKRVRYRTRLFPKNTICNNGLRSKSPVCRIYDLTHLSSMPKQYVPTGQAPYTGQATWFLRFHSEKLPSATARYITEILRVISVLELGLSRNATGWLVGDKCTYADLAFRTWAEVGEGVLREVGQEGELDGFPRYREWLGRMDELEGVRKVQERMREGRREHGLN
jgi:glutathione S-transferase